MNALAELYAVVGEAWREGDWRGHLRAWLRVISDPEVSESHYRPCLRDETSSLVLQVLSHHEAYLACAVAGRSTAATVTAGRHKEGVP